MSKLNYKRLNPYSFYQGFEPLFIIPVGDLEMVKVD